MNTTNPAPIRKSDISRALGRILGKHQRSAAHGWDVINDGARVIITLNYFSSEDDRKAFALISEALDSRYRLRHTNRLTEDEYEAFGEDYAACSVIDLYRHDPTPTTQETDTPTADTTPTVSLTLPAPFCAWLDGSRLAQGQDDADPDCKALRLAYTAAPLRTTTHGQSTKIVTSNPTILKMIIEYAGYCAEANHDEADRDDDAARELAAAETTAQRARTALRELRAAHTAHKAQQQPQQPPTATQGPQQAEERPTPALTPWEHELLATAHTAPATPRYTTADENAAQNDDDTPAPVTVDWTHTVRGHRNGTATINGTTYRITHITHADRKRGALGDHMAHLPATDGTMGPRVARTWGLDNLLARLADHAGITGPLTLTDTSRQQPATHGLPADWQRAAARVID